MQNSAFSVVDHLQRPGVTSPHAFSSQIVGVCSESWFVHYNVLTRICERKKIASTATALHFWYKLQQLAKRHGFYHLSLDHIK